MRLKPDSVISQLSLDVCDLPPGVGDVHALYMALPAFPQKRQQRIINVGTQESNSFSGVWNKNLILWYISAKT